MSPTSVPSRGGDRHARRQRRREPRPHSRVRAAPRHRRGHRDEDEIASEFCIAVAEGVVALSKDKTVPKDEQMADIGRA